MFINGVTQISIPNDGNQEWFITTLYHNNKTVGDSEYCRCIIYNKAGEQIHEFKSSSGSLYIYSVLYLINNKYKLLVLRNEYSVSNYSTKSYTDIYRLNIDIDNTAISSAKSSTTPMIQVFNTNGVLIEETDEDISTQNLNKGIYIVRENNQTKKIVLGK